MSDDQLIAPYEQAIRELNAEAVAAREREQTLRAHDHYPVDGCPACLAATEEET